MGRGAPQCSAGRRPAAFQVRCGRRIRQAVNCRAHCAVGRCCSRAPTQPARHEPGPASKRGLVEQFVTQSAVEAFYEGVLLRFAWRDVVPRDRRCLGRAQKLPCRSARYRCRRHTRRRPPATSNDSIELAGNPQTGQRCVADQGETFAGEVVDHRQDPERPSANASGSPGWSGPCGIVIGARVQSARLRPERRRTCSRCSR
jgi:hypothetical protein